MGVAVALPGAALNVTSGSTGGTDAVVSNATAAPTPDYTAADSVTIENTDVQPAEAIDAVLSRLVIHEDKPIENLPEMVSPELKLIGRCVSLCMKQTINNVSAPYYYTGLVAMVTDTTVTLMYVNRYTRADFQLYQTRERNVAVGMNSAGYRALLPMQSLDRRGEGGSQDGPAAEEGQVADTKRAASTDGTTAGREAADPAPELLPRDDPAGSLAPAVSLTLDYAFSSGVVDGGDDDAAAPTLTRSSRSRRFRTCATSLGTLPYVTFPRTSIHDVAFGRDPANEFYSLFQDPSKQLLDMQYLRMFVRRYLVHTSEGNNPRQVPMYAFLTMRGACPGLDHELANQLVREELPRLMKADRAIAKEKRRQRTREARLSAAAEEYEAPPGPFSNTGVLYLTQVPQQTMMSASIILVFTVGVVLFLVISLTTMDDTLITLFVASMLNCFIPAMMMWAMTGILTLLHSTAMHLPLRENLELLIARAVCSVGAVACAISCIVVITNRVTSERIWRHMYLRRYDSLCAFYEHHRCSGFYYACGESGSSDPLCNSCPIYYPDKECFVDVWSRLQFATMPLLLFSVFILLAAVNGLMLLLKLYLVSRSLSFSTLS